MIFRDCALEGKRAFVTGASSGIGAAAARMMAAAGAEITLCGRVEARLEEVRLQLSGRKHQIVEADVASVDGAHDAVLAASVNAGPFDIVFHSAGVAGLRSAKMINEAHVSAVFGAALFGALGLAKAAGKKGVLNDGAVITFVSSVAGLRGRAGMAVYSASRASIGGLTRALASELAPRSIRVNEVVAGAVQTPMHESISSAIGDAGTDSYRDLHLLGFGQPDDVASVVTFLSSDAARWVTGASWPVDGGYTSF